MALANGANTGLLSHGDPGDPHYAELMRQWRWIDFLLQPVAKGRVASLPTTGQADGDTYIFTGTGTNQNRLARWNTRQTTPGWEYLVPKEGWRVMVANEGTLGNRALYEFGTSWVLVSGGTGEGSTGPTYSPVVNESGTSRTLALADANAYLRFTSTSASTVTIPAQATVAWAADTEIHIRRAAAGNLVLTPASGVTLIAPAGGNLTMTDRMAATLKRVAENTWEVNGQTVAV